MQDHSPAAAPAAERRPIDATGRRPVGSTYRVQFGPGFGFDDAAALVPYLADLGVTHLYASPYLQAVPGSTHGYDVVDHGRPSDDLGGADAHRRMCEALHDAGLGQVLDIVPNHMAIGHAANRWWWDVLEHGRTSPFAGHFDVEWEHDARILLPVLGEHYGATLGAGALRIERNEGHLELTYADHRYPLAGRSYRLLLTDAASRDPDPQLRFLGRAFARLTDDPEGAEDARVLVELLGRLARAQPAVAAALDGAIEACNTDPARLHDVLECQHYRLAHWRTATETLGHRRFFDVTSLAGLRTEDPVVFADMHRRVLSWYDQGLLDGLRIDHPDGLRDPTGYLERLREFAPAAWIVVEKILTDDEQLSPSWPVAGTTGYDYLALVNGLWVDPAGEGPLTALYDEFVGEATGGSGDLAAVVDECKRLVVDRVLGAEVGQLVERFAVLCASLVDHRDHLRSDLRRAIEETIIAFPVYRTYVRPDPEGGPADVSEADASVVRATLDRAAGRAPGLDRALWDLLADVLLLRVGGPAAAQPLEVLEFTARFQQATGPAMAKGVEDTAFYRYNRLVALNEVGGDPARFSTSVDAFHRHNQAMARRWPHTMLATSTHDTKRSEDVRARLAVLSEVPEVWAAAVRRWHVMNERHRRADPAPVGGAAVDANLEYLLYQTLVGAHPLPFDRALAFATKAAREAKQHTSWLAPDDRYEYAVARFLEAILGDDEFLADLDAFVAPLIGPGRVNGLAQQVLKLTSVGVPDIYVGSELWTDGLVDPDNRRPVDLDLRRNLLGELRAGGLTPEQVMARTEEGLPKLFVTERTLAARKAYPAAFGEGGYRPLDVAGSRREHVVAFLRGEDVAVVAPRLVFGLRRTWEDTTVDLPDGQWRNTFDESTVSGSVGLAELLRTVPVAVLTRVATESR